MTKIELLQSYIEKCDNCDYYTAKDLTKEIVCVYQNEVKGITSGLSNYRYGNENPLDDIKILRAKLENYVVNLIEVERANKTEIEKLRLQAEISKNNVTVNNENINQNTLNSTTTVIITFEQVRDRIKNLAPDILLDSDKEELENKLSAIEVAKNAKDKKRILDKVGSVLKYIADKGIEVGMAVLPYLGEISKAIETM